MLDSTNSASDAQVVEVPSAQLGVAPEARAVEYGIDTHIDDDGSE